MKRDLIWYIVFKNSVHSFLAPMQTHHGWRGVVKQICSVYAGGNRAEKQYRKGGSGVLIRDPGCIPLAHTDTIQQYAKLTPQMTLKSIKLTVNTVKKGCS